MSSLLQNIEIKFDETEFVSRINEIAKQYGCDETKLASSHDFPPIAKDEAIKVFESLFGESMRNFYKDVDDLQFLRAVKSRRKRTQKQRFINYLKRSPLAL